MSEYAERLRDAYEATHDLRDALDDLKAEETGSKGNRRAKEWKAWEIVLRSLQMLLRRRYGDVADANDLSDPDKD